MIRESGEETYSPWVWLNFRPSESPPAVALIHRTIHPRPQLSTPSRRLFTPAGSRETLARHRRGCSLRARKPTPSLAPVNPLPPVDLSDLHFHLIICQTQVVVYCTERTVRACWGVKDKREIKLDAHAPSNILAFPKGKVIP